jgi:hypothetical protein
MEYTQGNWRSLGAGRDRERRRDLDVCIVCIMLPSTDSSVSQYDQETILFGLDVESETDIFTNVGNSECF